MAAPAVNNSRRDGTEISVSSRLASLHFACFRLESWRAVGLYDVFFFIPKKEIL